MHVSAQIIAVKQFNHLTRETQELTSVAALGQNKIIEYTHDLYLDSTSSSCSNKPISIAFAVSNSCSTECCKSENFFFKVEHSSLLPASACWEVLYRLRALTDACNGRFYANNGCQSVYGFGKERRSESVSGRIPRHAAHGPTPNNY